ncbi:hypothetical protein SLPG_00053 [Salicola phage CGphi29]|uniref:hypothetical protein n=1 Tax=Salicola phage CGphi29 TaxID=754067 RepID=UPI0002C14FF4|nr:hypothetical protein SLPG_00053 [Salicola phage CGphi29]AGH31847.1 hypothetical protein SLPG_00053 [Salicola phage CGphi29]
MTRFNQIAQIIENQQLTNGRKLTARFFSDGDVVTVRTTFHNTAETVISEDFDSLKNDEQKRFFVNAVN